MLFCCWSFVLCVGAAPASDLNVRITYKIDQRKSIVVVRASAALPFGVDTVTKFLVDVSTAALCHDYYYDCYYPSIPAVSIYPDCLLDYAT